VLQVEPGNVDATRRLARAYADMNLPDEALRTWHVALKLLPNDFNSYLDLGQFYYRRSQYEQAIENWETVTRIAPDLARGFHNLGAALNDVGRYAEAEGAFTEALRLQEHADTLIGFGSILSYQGRHEESAKYYERARSIGPVSYILLSNLGDAYRRLGRSEQSRDAYAQALALADARLVEQPRDAYNRVFVGYICVRLGDTVRGQREAAQALRFAPDDAKVIRRAALAHAAAGRIAEAVQLIESVPALLPEMSRHPDLAEFRGQLRLTN
jgi:tetratricopeptide (TPR) repeat protein